MRTLVREALSALGIERLVLGVHESCFPCDADEDLGRGSPYGALGRDLLRFAFELGFDTVQLGPQGECAAEDPSPYDGAAFARSTAALSLARLSEEGLLSDETRARLLEGVRGATSEHARAAPAMREVLDEAHRRAESTGSAIERRLGFIATHADWLLSDATYEALLAEHGEIDFVEWDDAHDRSGYAWPSDASLARRSAIESRHRAVMDRWVLAQALAHEQHDELRAFAHGLGLSLFGDLQIGWSRRDLWANQRLFLRELRLGAPPSRTNPEGQPWGYPVLDPAQPAAVGRLVEARLHKLAREYDGLRVDHPHGWVCPWVYSPVGEPHAAVRAGGRLHESPERPELARFAVVRREQLDLERAPWDDARVTALSPAQIDDYAVWIDRMRVIFGERLACEVLSTMPRP
ncbi:MAG: 4-alpha-glucanotransferase, partial [Sandaracinaceae bacterium]|nr:4-alpha-glucanotransferase [Sandaracinaceae bacterium]